jgi:ubiquinone/menaquinone biosynthesis C-methylase UbiE
MSETIRVQRIYDERAATYDRSQGIVERFVLGALRREYGSLLQGETIDIAVGTGLNLPFYSSAVTRAVGVDLSLPMLRQAQSRAASLGLAMAFVQTDAAALPFADGSFDTVAVSLALCTIQDPAAALLEMARVCRPDGRVVMLEHVLAAARPLATLQRILSPIQERSMGCHLDRQTFVLAKSLGFSVDQVESRLFDAVELVVARPPQASHATLDPLRSLQEVEHHDGNS